MEHPSAFARLRTDADDLQGCQPLGEAAAAQAGTNGEDKLSAAAEVLEAEAAVGNASLQDGDMASLLMGIKGWEQQQLDDQPGVLAGSLVTPDTAPSERSRPPQASCGPPSADAPSAGAPASEPRAAVAGSGRRAFQRTLASSGVQLLSRTAGAGVRTARAGVRSAARLAGGPLAAARRHYHPIGRQLYIYPWTVAPVAAGESA